MTGWRLRLLFDAHQAARREALQTADPGAGEREHTLVWWALGVAVVSRFFIFAVGFLARSTLPVRLHRAHPPLQYRGALGRLLNGWTNWDAGFYLSIAHHGYARPGSAAFFPLYPLIVHLFAGTGMRYTPAGIVVSLACFVAGSMLLYRLTAETLGSRTAVWTVVFLSIAPTSFFFQAIYTESLFLLLSVALFFFAVHHRWVAAGLMGLLATLTRSSGVVLVVPLALFYLQSLDWQWRRIRAGILSALLVPCGLLIYMSYLWSVHGDPLLFAKAEHRWHRYFALPYVAVWQSVSDAGYFGTARVLAHAGVAHLSGRLAQTNGGTANLTNLAVLLIAAGLIALGWRRLTAPYNVYAVFALIFVLFSPAAGQPLDSLPRFVLVVFPLFMALAACTERRPLIRTLVVSLCLVGLVYLTCRFVLLAWVA